MLRIWEAVMTRLSLSSCERQSGYGESAEPQMSKNYNTKTDSGFDPPDWHLYLSLPFPTRLPHVMLPNKTDLKCYAYVKFNH